MISRKIAGLMALFHSLKNRIKEFGTPPVFPDNENKTRMAQILFALLANMMLFIVLATLGTIFIFINKILASTIIGSLLAFVLMSYILVRYGFIFAASRVFVIGSWVMFTLIVLFTGRVTTSCTSVQLAITVIAGVLLGGRSALIFTLLSLAVGLGIALLESTSASLPHYFPAPPMANWVVLMLAFILTLNSLNQSLQGIIQSLTRARESEARLRGLSDNLPGGMTYQLNMGLDGELRQFTYVSAAVGKMHEFTAKEILHDAQLLYGQIVESDQTLVAVQEAQAKVSMTTFRSEARFRLPSGSIRWRLLTATPRRTLSGNLLWDGIEIDITEQKQVEHRLRTTLAEKDILLRELYHRTKNTLGVIRSMLLLQAAKIPDNKPVQKLVKDTENRIMTIALVHQKLYQSQDLSRITIQGYLDELAHLIVRSYASPDQNISLRVEGAPLSLLLDTAIPCGLIVNELLSNALKYAFPDNQPGEIVIRVFRNDEGHVELSFSDNGVGIPPGFDFRNQASFGLQTVFALAEQQMQGKARFSSDHGVTFTMEFPDTLYTERV